MFRKMVWSIVAVVAGGMTAAHGASFFAETNELGYSGTVQNLTTRTGPVQTSAPRDANIFITQNAPQVYPNAQEVLSSWFEQAASNTNDSFMQLYDNAESITSATAGWSNNNTVFTMTVNGANAPYNANTGGDSYSRMWQPDDGTAGHVTFLDYTYTLSATFATSAVVQDGFLVNSADPTSMSGNFAGTFLSTEDPANGNPHFGDIYAFNINYSEAQFDLNQAVAPIGDPYSYGGGTGIPATFVGVAVPLPSTARAGAILLGGLFLTTYIKRQRRCIA